MGDFRASGPKLKQVKEHLLALVRNRHLIKKLYQPYRYLNAFENPRIKDLIILINFFKKEELIDKIYKNIEFFIIPRTKNVRIKAIKNINIDIAYLIGVLCGDGSIAKNSYQIIIGCSKNEKKYVNILANLWGDCFGKKPFIYKLKRGIGIFTTNKVIHIFLTKVIGLPSGKKKDLNVPNLIKKDSELMKHFIGGFFDTDGTIYLKRGRESYYIKFSQKSKFILEEIQTFLNRFNIKSVFECDKRNEIYSLAIYRRESVINSCKLIKSRYPRKARLLNRLSIGPHNSLGKV